MGYTSHVFGGVDCCPWIGALWIWAISAGSAVRSLLVWNGDNRHFSWVAVSLPCNLSVWGFSFPWFTGLGEVAVLIILPIVLPLPTWAQHVSLIMWRVVSLKCLCFYVSYRKCGIKDHLKKFNELMVAFRVRPTILMPFWSINWGLLGACLSRRHRMASQGSGLVGITK